MGEDYLDLNATGIPKDGGIKRALGDAGFTVTDKPGRRMSVKITKRGHQRGVQNLSLLLDEQPLYPEAEAAPAEPEGGDENWVSAPSSGDIFSK